MLSEITCTTAFCLPYPIFPTRTDIFMLFYHLWGLKSLTFTNSKGVQYTGFWCGNLLESSRLLDWVGDMKMVLIWILSKYVLIVWTGFERWTCDVCPLTFPQNGLSFILIVKSLTTMSSERHLQYSYFTVSSVHTDLFEIMVVVDVMMYNVVTYDIASICMV
jgi:hypothetical protein